MTIPEIHKVIEDKVSGLVVPKHTDRGHFYEYLPTGSLTASVTTKLGIFSEMSYESSAAKRAAEYLFELSRRRQLTPQDVKDSKQAFNRHRDLQALYGTVVHDSLETWVNLWIKDGVKPSFAVLRDTLTVTAAKHELEPNGSMVFGIRSAWDFFEVNNYLFPIVPELYVYHDEPEFAGTFDLLCVDIRNNNLIFVDWKLAIDAQKSAYSMQIVAYKKAFEKMTGLKIHDCMIVQLSKEKSMPTVWTPLNFEKSWDSFKALCEVSDLHRHNQLRPIKHLVNGIMEPVI